MKLELTKEEVESLTFWVQANILTITNLIQTDSPEDTADDFKEYRKALKIAQSIYGKLTNSPTSGKLVSLN